MTSAVLRSAQAGAILTAVGLSAGLMTGVAVAAPPDVAKQSCLSPLFPGSDLNERYGVKERIIGPPASATTPACRTAFVGERWVRAVPPWITAKKDAVPAYPDGYDPCKDANGNPLTPGQTCSLNPIDDFNLKFAGARYVIDANDDGTGGQVVTAGPEILRKGFTVPPSTPNFGGDPFSSPVSPVFAHLPVGKHTVNVYVTMSERHCNGLTPVPTPALGLGPPPPPLPPGDTSGGAACLPKGESRYPILDNNEAEGGNKTVGLAFNVVLPTP